MIMKCEIQEKQKIRLQLKSGACTIYYYLSDQVSK